MIAADGDETVGELHDKTGCTEADDTFRERNAGGKFIFSDVYKRQIRTCCWNI